MTPTPQFPVVYFLEVSMLLFAIGLAAVLIRRNAIAVLMGVELMLNAANLNFVAFWRYGGRSMEGQVFAVIVITLAAAEAAIALAIILNIYRRFKTVNVDQVDLMKG